MRLPSTDDPRLRRLRRGRPVALPRFLDGASERWAALSPRRRRLVVCAAIGLLVGAGEARVHLAQQQWGGEPVDVLVADGEQVPGETPSTSRASVPPALVPPGAVDAVDDAAALALPLVDGAVLTEAHLDARGPGAGLGDDLRAVPIEVDEGWGVAAGGWVDVWVLGAGDVPAEQVAEGRPVLAIDVDDAGRATALVGLGDDEVAPTTHGIANGRVLLAHAPPP